MAQEQEDEILIEINLDEGATEKRIASLRTVLDGLKKKKDEIKAEFKKGALTAEEYAESIEQVERASKAVTKELNTERRTLELNDKAQKAAAGSIEEMRAQLSLLKAQYATLSEEERNNVEVGKVLLAQTAALNAELKTLEAEYGDHQREVGNYQKALLSAEQVTAAFGGSLSDVKERFEQGKTAINGMKLGLTGIKGAIAATGIGVLLLAFGALINFLTKTQAGMDFVDRKTKALQAVFGLASKAVSGVGQALMTAFTKPGEAIKSIGEAIKTNLTNRLDAFKRILDAIAKTNLKEIAKGLFQLFSGIKPETVEGAVDAMSAAAAEGERVAKVSQEILKAERELNVERAKSRASIEGLKKVSEDTNKSQAVRENAARKAYSIEVGLLNQQIALQERKIQNTKDEAALGEITNEQLDKIAEEEIKLAELREDSLGKQTELQNTLNALVLEGQKMRAEGQIAELEKEIANREEARKFITSDVGETLEEVAALQEKADIELLEKRKELIRRQGDLQKIGLDKNSEQYKLIEAQTLLAIGKLNNDFAIEKEQRLIRSEQSRIKAQLEVVEQGSEEELELKKKLIESELDAEAYEATRTIQNAEELAAKLQEIEARRRGQKRALDRDFDNQFVQDTIEMAQNASNLISTVYEAQIQNATKALDDQEKLALKSAGNNAEIRAKIEGDYQKKREDLEKKAAEKRKKIASIENLIQGAQAGTAALTLLARNPVLGALTLALVAGKTAINQALIDSQTFALGGVPQYISDRRGSYITGPGTGTSDSISAQISNGESVLNARSTSMFYDQLSAMNVAGGGRAFPGAVSSTIVPRFNYGGVVLPNDYKTVLAFKQALAEMPPPVVAVTDVHDKSAEVRRVEVRSKL